VSVRVSPTEKIRAEIDALFGGDRELGEVIEDVACLGARLIIQTALEAGVDAFLGRARYQRAAAAVDARPGSRNGYSLATVKTTAGPVTVARPKLRGTTEAFASRLFGTTVTKSKALESLVIAGFVRGLSVRDVENTLADALGAEAALSKSTVSRVCQAIGEQFEAWRARPLDGVVLDYLFLDASMFTMHPGARPEPVLAAWGIDTEGKPVFVALAPGGSESADAWGGFLDELAGRGLRPPLLVISDGAAGLINAIESSLPRSLRQNVSFTGGGTCSRRFPPRPRRRSAAPTGRSSTLPNSPPLASSLGSGWSPRCRPASTLSPASTPRSTPPRSAACSPTASSSPATCGSPPSITSGSGTPTSSNGPSARPAAGSRSSAACPARPAASTSSGPS